MSKEKYRLKYLNARYWQTEDQADLEAESDVAIEAEADSRFPELDPHHGDYVGDAKRKIGICFSGGGTRSATCTHGQLRALKELGVLERVGYISCVSGGAWAAVPYTFLAEHYEESHFFGSQIDPEFLAYDVLDQINQRNYLYTVSRSGLVDDLLKHALRGAGDESYSRALGEVFLEPFDLNSKRRFFAHSTNQVMDAVSRNPNMTDQDFYVAGRDRPFLIAGGTLLRPGNEDYLFEMTPWYSGIRNLYASGGSNNLPIGGGYIESFALDSDSPDEADDATVTVRVAKKRYRFTLSDMLGTTGAAPAEKLDQIGLDFIGMPEFKHWPLKNIGQVKAKEYEFGDGGNLENLGILPLLSRNVEKIIVFVNTQKADIRKNGGINSLFRAGVNQVFEESRLDILHKQLEECLAGREPVVGRGSYVTVQNDHHRIPAGHRVEVLWVYNHRYLSWIDQLPSGTQADLKTGRALANFPHYATFFENPPKVIDLDRVQINLLNQMSSASVLASKDLIEGLLSA